MSLIYKYFFGDILGIHLKIVNIHLISMIKNKTNVCLILFFSANEIVYIVSWI